LPPGGAVGRFDVAEEAISTDPTPKNATALAPNTSWQEWYARVLAKLRDRNFDAACAIARQGANTVGPESRGVARMVVARCLDLAGRPKEAIQHYQQGLMLVPPSWKHFMKAGICAIQTETYGLAERYLTIACLLGGQGWKVYFLKGVAECRQRKWPQAVNSFSAALARRPNDLMTNAHMAYVELQLDKAQDALERLLKFRDEITEWPEAWLWLVQAQRRCGFQKEALIEAGLLRDCHPDFRPALLMVGDLSMLQGDFQSALSAYERSQIFEGRPVTTSGTALMTRTHTSEEVAHRIEHCRNVLEQGLTGGSNAGLVQSYAMNTPVPPAFQPRFPTHAASRRGSDRESFARHFRTVHALLLREIRSRFARNKLGYIWALIDPALQVLVFYLIFAVMGRHDFAGMSLLLFLTTGVLPFSFMQNTYTHSSSAIEANKPLLSHPNVKVFDAVFARVLLQFCTSIMVFGIFLVAIWSTGEQFRIANPIEVVYCLALLTIAGMGLGLSINAFTTVMQSLPMLFGQVMRIFFFSSGIFFTVTDLPGQIREYVLYNPFLHLIDIVRFNFNPRLALSEVNLTYPTLVIVTILFLGLVSHFAMRRRILLQ